jgi:cysteine desulfurase / selenocysteine lyase
MTTNIHRLRKDFPIFAAKPTWSFLDTAATAQLPQQVIDAVAEYQCAYRAPVHRGLYREAVRATAVYEDARKRIASFIKATGPAEIIFTSGATGSSNMLVSMFEHTYAWAPGDEIVTTVMEHHSALVPLQEFAKRRRLKLKYIPLAKGYALDYSMLDTLITSRTRLVSVMLASNVLGTVNDVKKIAKRAHAVGALMVSDMTAGVGHLPVSVRALEVDFAYFSGHKFCGPTGIGVLWGTRALLNTLEPGSYGGGMIREVTEGGATWVEGVDRFEPGTPSIAGAIGMGASVDYLSAHDLRDIHRYVQALTKILTGALANIPGVRIFSAPPTKNVGIVSFVVEGVHPHDLAEIAARHGVAIRAGHHCAMPLHTALGVTATARASLYLYNTKADIDALVEAIQSAQKLFHTHTHA